jgi:hypothetical protein
MAEVEALWDSGLATPIPLNTAFETSGFRIVGTSLDYFDFRKLTVAEGRGLAVLGEAVVGATVARDLDLGSGDTLVSSPQNLFDLDGVYPLEMPSSASSRRPTRRTTTPSSSTSRRPGSSQGSATATRTWSPLPTLRPAVT